MSIILPLNNRRRASVRTDAYANERLLFPTARSLPCILTITHSPIHHLPHPAAALRLYVAFPHRFSRRGSSILLPLRHLDSERELCVRFPAGPDFQPAGGTLITVEWPTNGCLRCSPTSGPRRLPPNPIPHRPGSPWRPVAEWLGAFFPGCGWGIMMGGRA